MKRLRILLADDHSLVLKGVAGLLERRYQLVGASANGQALVAEALRLRPDIVVLDISMPILNGIDAAREIRRALPSAKLVFLTMHTNAIYLRKALEDRSRWCAWSGRPVWRKAGLFGSRAPRRCRSGWAC